MNGNIVANSTIFIDLFTEIEQELRKEYDERFYAGFAEMIRKIKATNPVVRMYYSDLQEFAQLRNAIVHTRKENFVIAEPHDEVVKQIRKIRNMLKNPPRLVQVMTKNPYSSAPNDSISAMLEAFAEKNIMRSPVIENGRILGMITSRTIAKWLVNNKNASSVFTAKVRDLLPFVNSEDYVVVSENLDVFSLAGMFKNSISKGKYLQAALITENGSAEGRLTGIITPADLPYLMSQK